jgi:hypothetical protein
LAASDRDMTVGHSPGATLNMLMLILKHFLMFSILIGRQKG